MKPLEALEKIKMFVSQEHPQGQMYLCETEEYKIIEKSLKALEIIKEKEVNVGMVMAYTLDMYNDRVYYNHNELTREEYDILTHIFSSAKKEIK